MVMREAMAVSEERERERERERETERESRIPSKLAIGAVKPARNSAKGSRDVASCFAPAGTFWFPSISAVMNALNRMPEKTIINTYAEAFAGTEYCLVYKRREDIRRGGKRLYDKRRGYKRSEEAIRGGKMI